PKPARFPLARARDPLLDEAAAEAGGNQSLSCVSHGFAERAIGNACLVCETHECFGFEYSHSFCLGLPWALLQISMIPRAIDFLRVRAGGSGVGAGQAAARA